MSSLKGQQPRKERPVIHNQHIDKDILKASDAHFIILGLCQGLQSCLELDMEKRRYSAQDILDVL
jgi:phosphoribosylformylglycinamidine (FGAM) synthase-like amidotransferase family enzyme